MNLRQMEVFHAIMVTGSVTAAARLLNVTQPAVSTVLKHCETQLKMKLFVRVAGRLQPTAEAHAIFPDIAAIFGRLEAVGRLTQDLSGGRLGTLSIAAAFPIANGYLAEAVATFMSARPNLRATLQSLTSPQVLDRVINREVELGVAHEPVVSPAVETEVLVTTTIACVMRKDHPLATQEEVEVTDLSPYPIITYLPQVSFRPYVDRAMSAANVAPTINVQISIAITGIMLARYGAGVALVEPALVESMSIPDIVIRPLAPRIEAKTLMIRLKDAPQSKAMKDFVTHLKAQVRKNHSH
ncbi:LysR family transcriptional regulator [Agaricicola taiwanensis]|uniref:LysR family transcriptional regulator n=2 Tax=Agaricicola taiwanensis TaxID=591372 RepID=A0A8J2VPE4_9RHOB|nr:LysR family transcriptional regulator [Agaricicola taiwanensis]